MALGFVVVLPPSEGLVEVGSGGAAEAVSGMARPAVGAGRVVVTEGSEDAAAVTGLVEVEVEGLEVGASEVGLETGLHLPVAVALASKVQVAVVVGLQVQELTPVPDLVRVGQPDRMRLMRVANANLMIIVEISTLMVVGVVVVMMMVIKGQGFDLFAATSKERMLVFLCFFSFFLLIVVVIDDDGHNEGIQSWCVSLWKTFFCGKPLRENSGNPAFVVFFLLW